MLPAKREAAAVSNGLSFNSVADPDLRSGAFFTPGSRTGMGGGGIQSQDPGILFFGLKVLEFFDANPDPGFGPPWTRSRDGKNRIRVKQSFTIRNTVENIYR
jgi:hypothetical protein